jgi:hypothetical protein
MSDVSTQIVSYVALAIAIGGMIVGVFNHKRIRSSCMGREASVSLDIENTSPKGIAPTFIPAAEQARGGA